MIANLEEKTESLIKYKSLSEHESFKNLNLSNELNQNKEENEKLKKHLEEKEKQIFQLKNEIFKISQENERFIKENKNFLNKNNDYQEIINKTEVKNIEQINNLNQKINKIENEYENLKKEYETFKKDNSNMIEKEMSEHSKTKIKFQQTEAKNTQNKILFENIENQVKSFFFFGKKINIKYKYIMTKFNSKNRIKN